MTLPCRAFRDPLDQLLEAEAESCKGCVHRTVLPRLPAPVCMNPAKKGGPTAATQRCDDYKDHE